ncbi:hypothetical protein PZA11_000912 [Diplocarpon coronariae]
MSDSYFSYRSQIPNLLHRDCLFDDYLGSPGPEAIEPGEPLMIEIPFDKVPAINVSCEFELTRITGPVARHEAGNIRRIALPSSFLSLYAEEDLIEAFRRLFNTFTSFGYLILNAEEPEPLTPGEILFFGVVLFQSCHLLSHGLAAARQIDQAGMQTGPGGFIAEYMQRFLRDGSTKASTKAREERSDGDSVDSEEVERREEQRNCSGGQDQEESEEREEQEIAQADKTKKSPKNKKHKKLQQGGGAKEGEWHGEGEETDDEERQVRQKRPERDSTSRANYQPRSLAGRQGHDL